MKLVLVLCMVAANTSLVALYLGEGEIKKQETERRIIYSGVIDAFPWQVVRQEVVRERVTSNQEPLYTYSCTIFRDPQAVFLAAQERYAVQQVERAQRKWYKVFAAKIKNKLTKFF